MCISFVLKHLRLNGDTINWIFMHLVISFEYNLLPRVFCHLSHYNFYLYVLFHKIYISISDFSWYNFSQTKILIFCTPLCEVPHLEKGYERNDEIPSRKGS